MIVLVCLIFVTGLSQIAKTADSPWTQDEVPHPILPPDQSNISDKACRYWAGYTDILTYRLTTCAHCYTYQFPDAGLKAHNTILKSTNGTVFTSVTPDIQNSTSVDAICRTLSNAASCGQWLACCRAAERCCETQQQERRHAIGGYLSQDTDHCPGTWDGYACWGSAAAGHTEQKSCPGYIPLAMPSRDAFKSCTENGTWFTLPPAHKEWTNYTACLHFDDIRVGIYIKVACCLVSLLALLPSMAIFIGYRSLRRQNRVRLHINLLLSFVLYSVVTITWELAVVYERMDNKHGDTVMAANTPACRLLYILTRYSSCTCFLWMFCEGLYLHRLIVKAFKPPGKLCAFYVLGWGFPCLPIAAYAALRLYHGNESCWVHHIGYFEWIVYVPNLLSLFLNFVFLVDILRILLTRIQSHPNEPNNYRRGLKATFVLVPLFGLQLILIIYRPDLDTTVGRVYEICSAVIVNTQGFFVSLIFCLINGEVITNLRRSCTKGYKRRQKNRYHGNNRHLGDGTYGNQRSTLTSDVYTREGRIVTSLRTPECSPRLAIGSRQYIAMKPVNGNGNLLLKP